jgi:hypothetical protein
MENKLKVISVPHTGTHFIGKLFQTHGFQVEMKHVEAWGKSDDMIFCPIRDPKVTHGCWLKRGRQQDFLAKWKILDEIYRTQKSFFLPIDTDDREEHLEELEKLLNVKFRTSWKPENSSCGPTAPSDEDLSEVYELDVVKKFYGR